MVRPHKPDTPTGCWGGLSRTWGYCAIKPRKGMLTCSKHRDQERRAQEIKKSIEENTANFLNTVRIGDRVEIKRPGVTHSGVVVQINPLGGPSLQIRMNDGTQQSFLAGEVVRVIERAKRGD